MTLESSLLYTKEDGSQDFVHDSYKDFFLARWFANRINEGRLSVEDAYKKYWSYKCREWLNRVFWFSDRYLSPNWEKTLLFLSEQLKNDKTEELVNIVAKSYFNIKRKFRKRDNKPKNPFLLRLYSYYAKREFREKDNPHEAEYTFSLKLASRNVFLKNKLGQEFIDKLFSSDNSEDKVKILNYISSLGYYSPRLIGLIEDLGLNYNVSNVKRAVVKTLGYAKHYDPILVKIAGEGYEDTEVRVAAIEALAKIEHYDPILVELAADMLGSREGEDLLSACIISQAAVEALCLIGHYDPKILELLESEFDDVVSDGKSILECIGYYKQKKLST